MRLPVLALFAAALVSCGGSRSQGGSNAPGPAAATPRMLVSAAGALPADALADFAQAGTGTPMRFLVLSAGSDTASGPRAAAALRAAGAIATSIRLTRAMAEGAQITSLLGGTHGVWLTGTNPRELGAALGGTVTAVALERRAREGMRIGGDGAGAGMIGSVMITGGDVPPPRRRGRQPTEEAVATGEGLNALIGTMIYAPADPRRKADALDSALASHPRLMGIQLDSGAALRVMSDGTWESAGASDVLILVPDASPPQDSIATPAHRTRILSPGSRFDPRTRTMLPLIPAGAP